MPTCKSAGLSEGSHCSVCSHVIQEQIKITALHDFRPTDVDLQSGTISYICSGCNKPLKITAKVPTEKEVYNTIISMKSKYPEGTPFDNNNTYTTEKLFYNVIYKGMGCAAFSFELSDAAFGDLPGRIHYDFSNLKVGDIIRFLDNTHSAVVLAVNGDVITITEANYNSTVHWERKLNLSEIEDNGWTYVITRYPE